MVTSRFVAKKTEVSDPAGTEQAMEEN